MSNITNKLLVALVLGLTCLGGAPAYAQTSSSTGPWMGGRMDMGWYLGASVGQSRTEIDASDVGLPAGFSFTSFSSDETDTGYKLFGGYGINRNFALEFGYTRLGKFSFNGTTTPAATASGTVKNNGWNIDLVGILPLQNNFSLLARVGAYYNETKASAEASGGLAARPGDKERETSLKLGLGVQYDFTPAIGVRAEWEHFHKVGKESTTGEGNINLYSVGGIFRFQ